MLITGLESTIEETSLCVCRFRECGEDLLMDVSEALFNELAFFKLMQDFRGYARLAS